MTAPERLDLDAIRARIDRAHDKVSALCSGKERWVMHIPAQPDHDPDLVIGAALRDADALVKHVERDDAAPLAEALMDVRNHLTAVAAFSNLGLGPADFMPALANSNPADDVELRAAYECAKDALAAYRERDK